MTGYISKVKLGCGMTKYAGIVKNGPLEGENVTHASKIFTVLEHFDSRVDFLESSGVRPVVHSGECKMLEYKHRKGAWSLKNE